MSTFNWKKIISIHKEIVKRGEDNFFSIPLNENLGFRSTYFENLDFLNPSGPWNISLDQIKNSKYIDSINSRQFDQFFLGGPLTIKKNNTDYALLHCTNIYPTPTNLVRVKAMLELKKAFPNIPYGLSDHTSSNYTCYSAVALGASVIEKHFTDDKN